MSNWGKNYMGETIIRPEGQWSYTDHALKVLLMKGGRDLGLVEEDDYGYLYLATGIRIDSDGNLVEA
jgi:hypothetical protein